MLHPNSAKIDADRQHFRSNGGRYVDGARDEELPTTPALARLSMIQIAQPRSPISPIIEHRGMYKNPARTRKLIYPRLTLS